MFVGSLTGNGRCKETDTASDVHGIPQTIPQTGNFVGCLGKDPTRTEGFVGCRDCPNGCPDAVF